MAADDTREPEAQTVAQAIAPPPRAPANIMPGGTAHTAGGEKADAEGPSYVDVVRSLGPEYYMNFHKRPCVRDSQLQGLAAGFAGGSLAAIIGSTSAPSLGREIQARVCRRQHALTYSQNLF
jgi:cytochrome c oxidase assembly protein subunit 20